MGDFRADNITVAGKILKVMFTMHSGLNQPYTWSFFTMTVVVLATFVAYKRRSGIYPILNLSRFWNLVLFFVLCGLTIIMGYFGNTVFIYGAF